jgi:hypothetical protein
MRHENFGDRFVILLNYAAVLAKRALIDRPRAAWRAINARADAAWERSIDRAIAEAEQAGAKTVERAKLSERAKSNESANLLERR